MEIKEIVNGSVNCKAILLRIMKDPYIDYDFGRLADSLRISRHNIGKYISPLIEAGLAERYRLGNNHFLKPIPEAIIALKENAKSSKRYQKESEEIETEKNEAINGINEVLKKENEVLKAGLLELEKLFRDLTPQIKQKLEEGELKSVDFDLIINAMNEILRE